MELKDPEVTKDKIRQIEELFSYFDEIVLTTPGENRHFLYSIGPARGDDRLYIHGVQEVDDDD